MRCPNCGEQNEPGARFCFNCGTELAAAAPAPDPTPPAARTPEPTPEPPRPAADAPTAAFDPDRPVWPPLRETPSDATLPPSEPTRPVNQGDTFVFPPPPASQPPPPQPAAPPFVPPPPLTPSGGSVPPQYPDWRMGGMSADTVDPEPPRRGRNRFLMIVLGILLGCLIICVALFVFSITPTGQDFFEDVGTSVADVATDTADNS